MTRQTFRETILASLPGTKEEIRIQSGVTQTTSLKWINELHATGEIHISAWKRHPRTGKHMPIFTLGAGKDAKCKLKNMTRKQYWARYRSKVKNTEKWDIRAAKNRGYYWALKAAKTPNTWLGALMGATC